MGALAPNRTKSNRGDRSDDRARIAQHYWAFLSYSHSDAELADWLHEALEQFRVPPALVGKLTAMGPVPRRLTPIFRDRHELAAADDLGEEIRQAIAGSRFLVVLCSPAAATSRWTNSEIDFFKRTHPDGCVLAAIVDGEPFASDTPGNETQECFPPALRERYDRRGRPTGKRAEPIAADLRKHRDGRELGLLKIVAGMLGLRLDELVQRETHRRHRRLTWLAAASIAGMAITSGLAIVAVQARDAARDERREAEGLIEFMLGDLRKRVAPLGRLDLLDSVGERALAYYEKQDKDSLSDDALLQRAKALTLLGEIANTRGDLEGALARYREAMGTTAEALQRTPDNGQRLFDHAQNVFWVGYIDWQRGRTDAAGRAFREYRRLADRMIVRAPNDPQYQLERIYADTNLGAVLLEQRRYREAANVYQSSLEAVETLIARSPRNRDYQNQLAATLAYLADARENSGQLDDALALRERQLLLLNRLAQASKDDTIIQRDELTARRSLSRLLASRGQAEAAMREAAIAAGIVSSLAKTEPDNTEWAQAGAAANSERADLQLALGRTADAAATIAGVCAAAERLVDRNRGVAYWRGSQSRCYLLQAKLALRQGSSQQAVALARQAVTAARAQPGAIDRAFALAAADMVLSEALRTIGQRDAAAGALDEALAVYPAKVELTPRELAQRAILLRKLGRDAAELERQLAAMGYQHPDYVRQRS
jgi:tetratricopeptide (TPR) repeat protein